MSLLVFSNAFDVQEASLYVAGVVEALQTQAPGLLHRLGGLVVGDGELLHLAGEHADRLEDGGLGSVQLLTRRLDVPDGPGARLGEVLGVSLLLDVLEHLVAGRTGPRGEGVEGLLLAGVVVGLEADGEEHREQRPREGPVADLV